MISLLNNLAVLISTSAALIARRISSAKNSTKLVSCTNRLTSLTVNHSEPNQLASSHDIYRCINDFLNHLRWEVHQVWTALFSRHGHV